MTLQDVINEVRKRESLLIEKKQVAMKSIGTIQTDDANLMFSLSEAIHDLYSPLFIQCHIEIAILEYAMTKLPLDNGEQVDV